MANIRFRIAKPSDAKQIADCHWHVRDRYSQGIFLNLGERFLRCYYKIILDDPYEIVVCAENSDGKILGFCSATLDGVKQAQNLKKHKIKLGLAALTAIIINPKLLKEVWFRYKSLSNKDNSGGFIHTQGVRVEYWCWRKDEERNSLSVEMSYVKDNVLVDLGYNEVFFEVDKFNKAVYKFNIRDCDTEPLEEITLPDGRIRVLFRKTIKHKVVTF